MKQALLWPTSIRQPPVGAEGIHPGVDFLVEKRSIFYDQFFFQRDIAALRLRTPIPMICLSFRALIFFSRLHHVLKMQPLSH